MESLTKNDCKIANKMMKRLGRKPHVYFSYDSRNVVKGL